MNQGMTQFEFCKSVLERFKGNWPVAGGLSIASDAYKDGKTVNAAEGLVRAKMATVRKRMKERGC